MNVLLYNISIIMLGIGIIMLTIYITKASNNNYIKEKQYGLRTKQSNQELNNIYDEKASETFKKMFLNSSIIQDYQSFDDKEINKK